MQWVERNTVPEVSRDRYGRRRGVRVFSCFGGTISNETAHEICRNPQNVTSFTSGDPLPEIGSQWPSSQEDLVPMALDFYTAQIGGNEIIVTANYSTDFSEVGVEFSFQNAVVGIPFAVKVPTGQASNQSAGGLAFAWQLNNLNVLVAQSRMTISKKLHLSQIEDLNTCVENAANNVYRFAATNGDGAPLRFWKFEGASATQIGPEGLQVRYQFVSDPGNKTIRWPSIFSDTDKYVIPRQANTFPGTGDEFVRPPFHEVKVLPPDPPPGNVYITSQPNPPKFTTIPTAIIGDGALGQSPLLPGIPIPINVGGGG